MRAYKILMIFCVVFYSFAALFYLLRMLVTGDYYNVLYLLLYTIISFIMIYSIKTQNMIIKAQNVVLELKVLREQSEKQDGKQEEQQ